MSDPITTVAETATKSAFSSFEIWFTAGLFVIAIAIGWYAHSIWDGYIEAGNLKADIKQTAAQQKKSDNASADYENKKSALDKDNQAKTEAANATKDTDCGTHALPAARLQLLKQPRSLPAS